MSFWDRVRQAWAFTRRMAVRAFHILWDKEPAAAEAEEVPRLFFANQLQLILAFLVACAVLIVAAAWTGNKAGELAASGLKELFIGWLPGSQVEVIRGVQERVLLTSLHLRIIEAVRSGMPWIFAAGALFFCYKWGKNSVRRIGTGDKPAYGILVRNGTVMQVLGPGGLVFLLRPFDALVEIPTSQYRLSYELRDGLYSKEEGTGADQKSPQPLIVKMGLYFSFPEVEKEYSVPQGDGTSKNYTGRELLLRMFYALPGQINLWNLTGLEEFLRDAVLGAVRQVLSDHDHLAVRQEKKVIEQEIKTYLVSETGNPFLELGIPPDRVDVELTSVQLALPDAINIFASPELKAVGAEAGRIEARGRADARRIEAEGEAAAATNFRQARAEELKAYIGQGVAPDVAAFVVAGAAGNGGSGTAQGTGLEALRDLAIVETLRGPRQQGQRGNRRLRQGRGGQQ